MRPVLTGWWARRRLADMLLVPNQQISSEHAWLWRVPPRVRAPRGSCGSIPIPLPRRGCNGETGAGLWRIWHAQYGAYSFAGAAGGMLGRRSAGEGVQGSCGANG